MSRIEQRFQRLRAEGRKAVIPFITAGDPEPGRTVELMHALVRGGADLIELGVPFSDPMADGPTIQRASERALAHGTSLRDVLEMVRAFREDDPDTPVVLMGYLNPVEVMGYDTFAAAAGEAGVDGLLTVDLPPDEAGDFLGQLEANGVDPIFLIAPNTGGQRMETLCRAARGFVYYVSIKGVTGAPPPGAPASPAALPARPGIPPIPGGNRPSMDMTGAASLDYDGVAARIGEIRRHTGLPVGVGFGIKDADSAARMAAIADAIIVGSAVVAHVERLGERPDELVRELEGFLASLREAVDRAAAGAA